MCRVPIPRKNASRKTMPCVNYIVIFRVADFYNFVPVAQAKMSWLNSYIRCFKYSFL